MNQHDVEEEGRYTHHCTCVKCEHRFKDWKNKQKHEGKVNCIRKSVTYETVVCEQDVKIKKKWGYEKKYENKSESFSESAPTDFSSGSHKHEKKHKHDKKKHDKKHKHDKKKHDKKHKHKHEKHGHKH